MSTFSKSPVSVLVPRRRFTSLKLLLALLILTNGNLVYSQSDSTLAAYLREHSQGPADYVLSKTISHRLVLIGEAHWLQQDVSLIAALIPRLQKADVDLGAEMFPATEQTRIDELTTAPEWNDQAANTIMRAASWPYLEYRDLLHAAWSANRGAQRHLKILALGPPPDWRKTLLPRGITYDSFMANLVSKHVNDARRRVVVYCGMHHAFTHYYQAELDNAGKAMSYMDRMGNILWRQFGAQVFLITLHKPIWCGNPAEPSYCLPFGGRVDCAAAKPGSPIGFDVAGSPLGDVRFEPGDYYRLGHPGLRFVDYTDGYVWLGPIESFRPVTIIPLSEYAPHKAAMDQVAHSNPFTDEMDVSAERLQQLWAQQAEASRDLLTMRKWKQLAGWRSRCQ